MLYSPVNYRWWWEIHWKCRDLKRTLLNFSSINKLTISVLLLAYSRALGSLWASLRFCNNGGSDFSYIIIMQAPLIVSWYAVHYDWVLLVWSRLGWDNGRSDRRKLIHYTVTENHVRLYMDALNVDTLGTSTRCPDYQSGVLDSGVNEYSKSALEV